MPAGATAVLPTTPCSVVWSDGHPFVLDGEPGTPTPRRWVGLDDSGAPVVLTGDEMSARGWSVVYTDARRELRNTTMSTEPTTTVATIGQVWKDMDPREEHRFVKITSIDETHAHGVRCRPDGAHIGGKTRIRLDRLRGTDRSGWKLTIDRNGNV